MAYIQYLTIDGTPLPLPDSYEVQMADGFTSSRHAFCVLITLSA